MYEVTADDLRIASSILPHEAYNYYEQPDSETGSDDLLNSVSLVDEQQFVRISELIADKAQAFYPAHHHYDYNAGDPYCRDRLISGYRQFFNLGGLPATSVFFGCGSADLFKTLLGFILPPGVVIGPALQYPEMVNYVVASGRQFMGVAEDNHEFPTQKIVDLIRQQAANCSAVLMDRPSNPSGLVVSLADLSEILQIAKQEGILVIVDEAYANYIPNIESAATLLQEHHNLVLMRSNAKGYGIGSMRVSYLTFGSSSVAAQFAKVHSPFTPDLFSVHVAIGLFQLGESYLTPLRKAIATSKTKLIHQLKDLGFQCLPSHDNVSILMFQLPGHDLRSEFHRANVLIRDDSAYGLMFPTIDESYCRIRVPLSQARYDRFIEAAASVASP